MGVWIVALLAGISTIQAQQQDRDDGNGAPPSWLIRKPLEESVLHVSNLLTSEARYKEGDEAEGFVSFGVNRPAYVYLFNISPEEEADGEVRSKVHLLLPNRSSPDNFFQPGSYTLEQTFEIPGPGGEAFIQAIATPLPLDLGPSSDEEFRFMGDDPALVFAGIQILIEAKGLVAGDWAADWIHYGVESGGATPFGLPLECAKVRIEVPQAEGKIVRLRIDKDCYNKSEIEREFVGPRYEFPFVLAGERTFTINVEGFEEASQTVRVEGYREVEVNEIVFSGLKPAEYFDIDYEPGSPGPWQEVTFTARVQTEKAIEKFEWLFGDGEGQEVPPEVITVTHSYRKEGSYLVTLIVHFQDGGQQIVTKSLQISPLPICPPEAEDFRVEFFTGIIRIATEVTSGCVSVTVPSSYIEYEGAPEGKVKISGKYLWEAIPQEAEVYALLFISWVKDGRGDQSIMRLSADKRELNDYIDADIPSGSEITLELVLNVIDNPKANMVALQVETFTIATTAACEGARLEALLETRYADDVYAATSGEPIPVRLINPASCPPIEVPENSLSVLHNGTRIRTIQIASTIVAPGEESAPWDWDQKDDTGRQVSLGSYTIELSTGQGNYSIVVVISENRQSE